MFVHTFSNKSFQHTVQLSKSIISSNSSEPLNNNVFIWTFETHPKEQNSFANLTFGKYTKGVNSIQTQHQKSRWDSLRGSRNPCRQTCLHQRPALISVSSTVVKHFTHLRRFFKRTTDLCHLVARSPFPSNSLEAVANALHWRGNLEKICFVFFYKFDSSSCQWKKLKSSLRTSL